MELEVKQVYDFNELYNSSWGGAINTLKTIEENEKEDELLELLNDVIGTGINRTTLNDYLWFDDEQIFELLGIEVEE